MMMFVRDIRETVNRRFYFSELRIGFDLLLEKAVVRECSRGAVLRRWLS